MRFDWLRCRAAQLQFDIYWAPGHKNFANYFTKHHPPVHHIAMQPIYLAPDKSSRPITMQECHKILAQRLGKKLPVTSSEFHSKSASQFASQWSIKPPAHKLTRESPGHNSNRILLQPLRLLQPASQNTSTFRKPLPSLTHIKWIQTPMCNYNKQLRSII